MSHDLKEQFWQQISKVQAGMLETAPGRMVPMAPQIDADAGEIWFITAEGTEAQKAAKTGGEVTYVVAEAGASLYARVSGRLAEVNDEAKLDELWSPMASMWFEDGREDEDVRLLKFTPADAEVWITESAAGFLYEALRAMVSDYQAEGGVHGKVTF